MEFSYPFDDNDYGEKMKYYNPYYESNWKSNNYEESALDYVVDNESDYSTNLNIINNDEFMGEHYFMYSNCDNPEKDILRSQAYVARCEAKLFCEITQRLCCELRRMRCLSQVECIVDIANELLRASACKEKSLAQVIEACAEKTDDDYSC